MGHDHHLIRSRRSHAELFGGNAIDPLRVFERGELKPKLITFLPEFPPVLSGSLHTIGQPYYLDSRPHIDADPG
jgi:hypothetical protein